SIVISVRLHVSFCTLSLHVALPILALELAVELLDPPEHRLGHLDRRELPGLDLLSDLNQSEIVKIRRRHRFSFPALGTAFGTTRSEEHTSELQSRFELVCHLLLEHK